MGRAASRYLGLGVSSLIVAITSLTNPVLAQNYGPPQGYGQQQYGPPQQQPYGPPAYNQQDANRQSYGTDNRYCDRTSLSNAFSGSTNNVVGSALGAAGGGLLGSQFGKGSGHTVMTIAGVLAGALAGGTVGRSMEPVDQGCINQSLEHTPNGQSVAWQNPDNRSSYWVTPTSTYQAPGGRPCRKYVTTAVIDGRTQRLHGRACRQPDGSWKQQ